MKVNPLNAIDFYKSDHRTQYPSGTTEIYSNFTPRSSKRASVIREFYDEKILFFGLQYFIKDFLIQTWNEEFFQKNKDEVLKAYQKRMDFALGKGAIKTDHIAKLHDLGFLPLKIKALPEGTRVPIGVPVLTIVNTNEDFAWLTNYVETILSNYLWKPMTSASTAFEFRRLLNKFAEKTGSSMEFTKFQSHDFSFRSLCGPQDAASSGAAHLTCFFGTDTVTAIDFVEDFYEADAEKELIGSSVAATEHSVMCIGTKEGELDTFKRLINDIYPEGILSIVADSWDYWKVMTEFLAILKPDILKRKGKIVIRPDSGDPAKIITGDKNAPKGSPESKGTIEHLWEMFGGSFTKTGHKLLDPHIGVIYGDSINLERAHDILQKLDEKGFASENIIFGVGSLTYQNVTRDSFGFAIKATSGVVNGERRDIFKNPKTDSGLKKSASGLLRVEKEGDSLVLFDRQTVEQEKQGLLELVFEDGNLVKTTNFAEIRGRVNAEFAK